MKQFLLFVFLLFNFSSANAQCWANAGAIWYYDYAPNYPMGYIKVERTGDTVIAGRQCDMLLETSFNFNASNPADTVSYTRYYTYATNDTVYMTYLPVVNFKVLYGFVQPGDTIMPCGFAGSGWWADSSTTVMMNNQQLWKVYMHKPGCLNMETWVMDKIGCELVFRPISDCFSPGLPGYHLRCYYDATGLYYNSHLAPYCDYTAHNLPDENITAYSDPFGITVYSSLVKEGTQIKIFDDRGRLIAYSEGNSSNTVFLPNANLSTGTYFVQLINGDESKGKKFLVK